jgi:hypothetical protein
LLHDEYFSSTRLDPGAFDFPEIVQHVCTPGNPNDAPLSVVCLFKASTREHENVLERVMDRNGQTHDAPNHALGAVPRLRSFTPSRNNISCFNGKIIFIEQQFLDANKTIISLIYSHRKSDSWLTSLLDTSRDIRPIFEAQAAAETEDHLKLPLVKLLFSYRQNLPCNNKNM